MRVLAAFGGIVVTVGASSEAKAQLIDRYFPSDLPGYGPDTTGSVVMRQMIENSQPGIPVHDFIVRPKVSQSVGYNANVLATPGTGSAQLDTSASLRVNSDWRRNAAGVSVGVANKAYPSLSQAGYTNWNVGAGGALDIGRDRVSLGYSHSAQHLSATDLGNFGVAYPVPYAVDDLRIGYSKTWGRFSLIPGAAWDDYSFGSAIGPVAYDSRDFHSISHQTESQMLQSRFAISQGDAVVAILRASEAQFVKGSGTSSNYIDGGGFVGVDLRSDAVLQYRALVGGETRHFTNASTRAIVTPTAEVDVIWTPGRRNTITLTGWRGIFDPTSPFSRNQTASSIRLQFDRELHHDLYLRGFASAAKTVSRSSDADGPDRRQTQFTFGVGVNWKINRDFTASLNYSHMNSYSHYGVAQTTSYGVSRSTYAANAVILSLSFAR
ncbi:outer membrane beta-barrel protein [Acetobacter sp. DsW_063]|uniref:outer membrane beta-barrel protein n=1 Tax=Acetobacter sp. DsW_063 TaxID=1514894 RepID=UPI000B652C30|nr:outer membrane beta-barrel protein [Acetobacter sp. DsW_063]OUJ14399.1 hypothetical protein HK28_13585 [Acetobacter sp. DsW_063]